MGKRSPSCAANCTTCSASWARTILLRSLPRSGVRRPFAGPPQTTPIEKRKLTAPEPLLRLPRRCTVQSWVIASFRVTNKPSIPLEERLSNALPPVAGHPDPLMLPAIAAHTTSHVCGGSARLKVVPTGCRHGGIQRCRPLVVSFGQSPYLVRCQSELLMSSGMVDRRRSHRGVAGAAQWVAELCALPPDHP